MFSGERFYSIVVLWGMTWEFFFCRYNDASDTTDGSTYEGKTYFYICIPEWTILQIQYMSASSWIFFIIWMWLLFSEYVALYTYESPEPSDLTFSEGDTILVAEREGEWWKGSIGDRSGVFPSNYVKPKETDVIYFWLYGVPFNVIF